MRKKRNQEKETIKKYELFEKIYYKSGAFIKNQKNILYMISILFFVIFGSLALLSLLSLIIYQSYLFFIGKGLALTFCYIVGIALLVSFPFYITIIINNYVLSLLPMLPYKDSSDKEILLNSVSLFKTKFILGITYFCFYYIQIIFVLLLFTGIILLIINRNNIIDIINIKIIGLIIIILLIFIAVKVNNKKK